MGAADAVPGISGGTVAVLVGIYQRFIAALASFKPSLWPYLRRRDMQGLWLAIDGGFLASVGTGILLSLFTFLSVIHWLLLNYATVLWAFFSGLILVSLYYLVIAQHWSYREAGLFLVGLTVAVLLALASGIGLTVSPATLFLGGALAVSAMLLPGISGSFILLLLGLYPVIVEAVHDRNLQLLMWVAGGALVGLFSFSQVLQWALSRWHQQVMAVMLGFVAGALIKVWPWQYQGSWYLPASYEAASGKPADVIFVILAAFVGGLLVTLLYRKFPS